MTSLQITRSVCLDPCALKWSNRDILIVQLTYPTNTSYQKLPGTRCCDNCTPRLFEIELVKLESAPALKRGKKRKWPEAVENVIREGLRRWRDKELLDKFYPGTSIVAGATLFGDDLLDKLALCGERVDSADLLARYIRWPIGIDADTHVLTPYGEELLAALKKIYATIDDQTAADEAHTQNLRWMPIEIPTDSFYQHASTSRQGTGHGMLDDAPLSTVNTEGTNEQNMPRGQGRSRVMRGRARGTARGRGRPRGRAGG